MWIKTGTVSVATGSQTVTGAATAFDPTRVLPGYVFIGPDNRFYEIQQVVSDTLLTLTEPYTGPTLAAQSYRIVPLPFAANADILAKLQTLLAAWKSDVQLAGTLKVGSPTEAGAAAAIRGALASLENAGSVAFKIVKGALVNTAFVKLFTGSQQRARFGLDGNDQVALDVSADGTTFTSVLQVGSDGHMQIVNGVKLSPGGTPAGIGNGSMWYDQTTQKFRCVQNGVTTDVVGVTGTTVTTAVWGALTGSLASQADLAAALNGKQPLNSTLTSLASATAAGLALATAADAPAQRTALGLGSAAVQAASAFEAAGAVNAGLSGHVSAADPHPQYLTTAEGNSAYTPASHAALTNNPHGVTKAQVGLGAVDNTSDADKPVSAATQTALDDRGPIYSLFPDAYFRTSKALGRDLFVNSKTCFPVDAAKSWNASYKHAFGKGAWKVLGTGAPGKFHIWFDAPAAQQAGVTTGTNLILWAVVRQANGQAVNIAARFIDAVAGYVGSQTGTGYFAGTGGTQVVQTLPVAVPAGAAGVELMVFSATNAFAVFDVDATPANSSAPGARIKAGGVALASVSGLTSGIDTAVSDKVDARDTVSYASISDVSAITVTARVARDEASGFTGWGQTYTTPATLSRNAVFIREFQRGPVTSQAKKWTRLKVHLKTHVSNASLPAATVVAVGEIAIPPSAASLADVVVPLLDPVTFDPKTVTQADLLAQYAIMYEAFSDSGKAIVGECLGTVNTADGARVASYYVTGNDGETQAWLGYASTIALGLCTVTSPVVTRSAALNTAARRQLGVLAPARKDMQRLRRLKLKQRQKEQGLATPRLVIGLIGDSWTVSSNYFAKSVADQLIAKFGDGGIGWFGFGFVSAITAPAGDARGLYYVSASAGAWTSNYHAGSTSPNISDARSSAAAASFTMGNVAGASHPTLSAVKLHFTGTADGVIRWRWNAGAWSANTTVQGGVGVQQTLDLTGFPVAALVAAAANTVTLQIEVVSGSVVLCGVDMQSTTAGAVLHKLGSSGSKASDWTAPVAAQWQAGVAALGCDTFHILLGVNDQAGSVGADAFASYVRQLIDRVRTATPAADVMLSVPPDTPAAYNIRIDSYADALVAVADDKNAAYCNLQHLFGTPAATAEYASAGAFPLFLGDNAHPNTNGSVLLASEIYSALMA